MSFLGKAVKSIAGVLKPKPEQSQSSSQNVNNDLITSTFTPQAQQGTQATNFLAQLLGVSPQSVSSTAGTIGTAANGIAEAGGANAGYNNYLQLAGYAPAMTQLSKNITGQGAASGLLNSGSTAKALQTQGANLNSQYFQNYLQNLAGLSGLGTTAGGLIGGTGQQSSGEATGKQASDVGTIAKTVGSIASIFSDRRLKRDIKKISEFPDGLGIYEYRYAMGTKRVLGVMANEVARIRPWALGPMRAGYNTVNYGAL